MVARVIIDLDACGGCARCGVRCGRRGGTRPGAFALRERATYSLVCRRCEEPSCVDACPFDALRRRPDGVLERLALLCVSCKLCAHACPFGTIYPDMVPFYTTPCETCLDEADGPPPCVGTCERGAVAYGDPAEAGPDVHVVDAHLAARGRRWVEREAPR